MERMWRQGGLEDAETGGIGELSLYDQHPADLGSEVAARQTDIGLQQNMERLLDQVEKALKRIDEGTYGTCERCGGPIGKERLDAVPYATLCIGCQEEVDGPATAAPRRSDAVRIGNGRTAPRGPGNGSGEVDLAGGHYARHVPGDSDRPIEETVLEPPFGRTFRDGDDYTAFDGEDAWQDVARYGTSNTPSDVPGSVSMDEVYVDADEARGIVESVEAVMDIGGRGVTEADIFPEPDHVAAQSETRPGGVGAEGMMLGYLDGPLDSNIDADAFTDAFIDAPDDASTDALHVFDDDEEGDERWGDSR